MKNLLIFITCLLGWTAEAGITGGGTSGVVNGNGVNLTNLQSSAIVTVNVSSATNYFYSIASSGISQIIGNYYTNTTYGYAAYTNVNGIASLQYISGNSQWELFSNNTYYYYISSAGSFGSAAALGWVNNGGTLPVPQPAFNTNIVYSTNYSPIITGNGGGLTNYQGYNISGQVVQGNAAALTISYTGNDYGITSGYTTAQCVTNNWSGYTISGNTYGGSGCLTNSSYFDIYTCYPTNYVVAGTAALNALTGWADLGPYSTYPGYPAQAPVVRLKTSIIGNRLAMLFGGGGQFFWSSDTQPENPKMWSFTNVTSFLTVNEADFAWPNFGFHTIEINFFAGGIYGLYVPPTNSFVAVRKPNITGIVFGDSITGGTGSSTGSPEPDSYAGVLQDALEPFGVNVVPQGEGGTGYITTNFVNGNAQAFPFFQRMTNCAFVWNPQFIIWAGGVNDGNNTNAFSVTNALYKAATNVYLLTKSYLPNCKQMVIAPWTSLQAGVGIETNSNITISNAAAACGIPVICPEYSTGDSWIHGAYNVAGSGTAYSYYYGGPHPNVAGHYFYGHQIASFVLTNLITNAVPYFQ